MARMTTDLQQDYAGDVELRDDSDRHGEILHHCRLFSLGDTLDLRVWNPLRRTFERIDRISDVEVADANGGRLSFTGVSERLTAPPPDGNGVSPADARVTWLLEPKGCASCY